MINDYIQPAVENLQKMVEKALIKWMYDNNLTIDEVTWLVNPNRPHDFIFNATLKNGDIIYKRMRTVIEPPRRQGVSWYVDSGIEEY